MQKKLVGGIFKKDFLPNLEHSKIYRRQRLWKTVGVSYLGRVLCNRTGIQFN